MGEELDGCRECSRLQSRLERALRQLERQLAFGEELRVENEALKQQIQDLRQAKKTPRGATDTAAQTESEPAAVGDPELEAAAAGAAGAEQSVAELLRDTANACLNQNGYVYDEKSGLYYDYNSGYYYDPVSENFCALSSICSGNESYSSFDTRTTDEIKCFLPNFMLSKGSLRNPMDLWKESAHSMKIIYFIL